MFSTYLELGVDHILDIKAYDHLLFIVALVAPFVIRDWKKVIIMATAFTVGHSLTLILNTLELVQFPSEIIEFLIPLTIFITAAYNILRSKAKMNQTDMKAAYAVAMFFGLIHGMGFSNFLRASLLPGEEDSLITQLLAFNIGIEVAQIIIIVMLLGLYYLLDKLFKLQHRYWMIGLSLLAGLKAIDLMIKAWPW